MDKLNKFFNVMRKLIFFIAIVFISSAVSCGNAGNNGNEKLVLIKTDYGNIKIKLYDKTPEHKKNFLKLVNDGFYDNLLFHRVIENFMIQGGDPNSKNAEPGKQLGGGSPDYTLPAEFVPEYYHKRGALAAARQGDRMNPQKRSSSSQFYIVQGEIYRPGQLDTLQMYKNENLRKQIFSEELNKISGELNSLKQQNNLDGFNRLVSETRAKSDSLFEISKKYKLSEDQRETYTTEGGYPSLDGDYTVFGEVVEGMEVVDKIAAVETDAANRPAVDVKMEMEVIQE
jgi:peptidyl-prolyl cis-trans isomerase B (cyclophilin B)